MTDISQAPAAASGSSFLQEDARTKRRNAAERRFQFYGIAAITIGLVFLLLLLIAIVRNGIPAFTQTFVTLEVPLIQEELEKAEKSVVKTSKYRGIIQAALVKKIEDAGLETPLTKPKALGKILSSGAPGQMREVARAELALAQAGQASRLGQTVTFRFLTSSRVDGYMKGRVERADLARDKNLDAEHLDLVDQLVTIGSVERVFNWDFIFGRDASESRPEAAGIGVSMLGSFFMMLVVLGLALPIGVAASIYLEEFAKKNWFTDLIEVNISNLAAVPSIVFGILGLAVFIQFAHLPQSAPLVGGLVLTLMTLPTVIIATRASLKAVPPSIRDAALGVGASRMQAVFHHVLPSAAPGILTGTIIGLAQALGETAPLLLIGMVGLIATNYPCFNEPTAGLVDGVREFGSCFGAGFADPNSAMPAQIYQWASRADPAYYERAWGGDHRFAGVFGHDELDRHYSAPPL